MNGEDIQNKIIKINNNNLNVKHLHKRNKSSHFLNDSKKIIITIKMNNNSSNNNSKYFFKKKNVIRNLKKLNNKPNKSQIYSNSCYININKLKNLKKNSKIVDKSTFSRTNIMLGNNKPKNIENKSKILSKFSFNKHLYCFSTENLISNKKFRISKSKKKLDSPFNIRQKTPKLSNIKFKSNKINLSDTNLSNLSETSSSCKKYNNNFFKINLKYICNKNINQCKSFIVNKKKPSNLNYIPLKQKVIITKNNNNKNSSNDRYKMTKNTNMSKSNGNLLSNFPTSPNINNNIQIYFYNITKKPGNNSERNNLNNIFSNTNKYTDNIDKSNIKFNKSNTNGKYNKKIKSIKKIKISANPKKNYSSIYDLKDKLLNFHKVKNAIGNFIKNDNDSIKNPEELHFLYVKIIQNGKKISDQFESEND